jgi:hypothetical protein
MMIRQGMQIRVPGVSLESAANQARSPSGVLRLGNVCKNRVRTSGLSEHSSDPGAYFTTADPGAALTVADSDAG